jgi:uncharacterized protein (TIGR03435 family)
MDRTLSKSHWGRLLLAGAVIAIAAAPLTHGQSPQTTAAVPATFDVASIRPVAPPYPSGGGPWTVNHGKFRAQIASVRSVIAYAYNLMNPQVRGGPDWLDRQPYDFNAESDTDANATQVRQMLQTLLADRFKLMAHHDTEETEVFVLSLGKNGTKMQQSEEKDGRKGYGNWTGPGQGEFTNMTMLGLVNVLSGVLRSPVVDRTGLKGLFNFKLDFSIPRPPQPGGLLPDDSRPDIFAAVQEQLGLKLESTKSQLDTLIIDHIEPPAEN